MWQINEVLKFDDQLYRILFIDFGDIFWIQINKKNALPEVVREEALSEYLDNERLTRAKDPFVNLILEEPALDSIAFIKRDKAFNLIREIIQEPNHYEPSIRATLIHKIESSGLVSKPTIYKYLRHYCQIIKIVVPPVKLGQKLTPKKMDVNVNLVMVKVVKLPLK